ncbi:DUF126 domain-containing protein [Pusillimonas caeni]|uniref:aconitase X swivel domain-containing protein n=1 Tax=Pusillimonas caeni TaxID=1348472 RepID=UPI000E59E816|nr:DUF126 domain-containing protein [Pusillimonas caeni]TFL13176.1 DUF126 domain-containing protein [Pusillimonas caeni]
MHSANAQSRMGPSAATRLLRFGRGYGEAVEGELIVSSQGFNARYDMDLHKGIFSRPGHDLYGQSIQGKIYVFSTPKGGIATSWALANLCERGLAPLALICRRANPVVVQGAVLARIPIVDCLEQDSADWLETGQRAHLDPARGELIVYT